MGARGDVHQPLRVLQSWRVMDRRAQARPVEGRVADAASDQGQPRRARDGGGGARGAGPHPLRHLVARRPLRGRLPGAPRDSGCAGWSSCSAPSRNDEAHPRGNAATHTCAALLPLTPWPQVQAGIGAKRACAFDLTAACSGFVLGLITASQYIRTGTSKKVLLVGGDALSRFVDWKDRGACDGT